MEPLDVIPRIGQQLLHSFLELIMMEMGLNPFDAVERTDYEMPDGGADAPVIASEGAER